MSQIARLALVIAMLCLAPFAAADYPPPVPDELILTVRETAGVDRQGEVVQTGIPLPRGAGIVDPVALVVVDDGGVPVPAEFRVLARWHASLADTSAPVQWLLVAFPASVAADGSATFRLVLDGSAGSNPPPAALLTVNQVGDEVTVDTGAARFVLGGAAQALFDEVAVGASTLVTGSDLVGRADGTDLAHDATRDVRVEFVGPLTAVVTVEGVYDFPAVGGGGLGTLRRYVFTAGSPVARVRHAVSWEGDRCGMDQLECGGTPNAVLVERIRDRLDVSLGGAPWTATLVGARTGGASTAALAAGQTAAVRQLLRADHVDPLAFTVDAPGVSLAGTEADGALLGVTGSAGTVAVALDHMHRYEPQALRWSSDGALEVDLADDTAWLANRQGLFARFAVGAWTDAVDASRMEREVWAPLNHPLRAWPEAQWFAASRAVPELPSVDLPAEYADYDTLVSSVLDATLTSTDETGIAGLTTFGVFPRIWGNPVYTDEIDCVDQTPGQRWDNKFWCASWTDYHNAAATAPIWAMRSGEVEWLDEIAEPAALRTLHTQVIQCAPGDNFFYCGQAPTGYGAYRSDNNGSHGYFRNLILYYWLTGDEWVLRTLQRGAASMREFMCPGRGADPPGPTCAATQVPVDDWALLNGRSASQWYEVFRFLGLASDDPSFLDDWTSNTARWLSLYFALPQASGDDHGLVSSFAGSLTTDWISGPGTYFSDQLWMASLYDFSLLERLAVDTNDAALGSPAVSPRTALGAWGQTLLTTSTLSPWSNGGPDAPWPNALTYTFSGSRIGGSLDELLSEIDGDGDGTPCEICGDDDGGLCIDLCLYDTGKAPLSGALMRAADATGDAAMRSLGQAFTLYTLDRALADLQPLNKFTGEYLTLLHPAVARLTTVGPPPEIFADGFESGDFSAWSSSVP